LSFCTSCGNLVPAAARYCPLCGSSTAELVVSSPSRSVQLTLQSPVPERPRVEAVNAVAVQAELSPKDSEGMRPLSDSEYTKIKRMGAGKRNAAVLVGFIGGMLGVITMFSPPADPTVLSIEVIILEIVGLVLASLSRRARMIVSRTIELGTASEAYGVARSLADGTDAIDMGAARFLPLGKSNEFSELTKAERGPVRVVFAGPTKEKNPHVLLLEAGAKSFLSPVPCSWVRTT